MGSSDEYCRGSGLVQLLLDAMSSPRPAYCTQQTGGLTWGFTLRAIRTPPDRSRRSIPCQIDGSVPHPARPPTLRASRYRTFSHGWAFRPIEPDHDQSFGVPKCGHCQGGVTARRAVDRWSARSAGCRAAPERQIGLAGGQGRWTSIPARPGRRPRLTPLASTTPGG